MKEPKRVLSYCPHSISTSMLIVIPVASLYNHRHELLRITIRRIYDVNLTFAPTSLIVFVHKHNDNDLHDDADDHS